MQLLANRGYAVLQVNFRGSTGYGKAFMQAAKREFAGRMQDDLLDALDWAVAEGITDPDRRRYIWLLVWRICGSCRSKLHADRFVAAICYTGMSACVRLSKVRCRWCARRW